MLQNKRGGAMTPKFVCIFVRSMYQTSCRYIKQMKKHVFHFRHFLYFLIFLKITGVHEMEVNNVN